MKTYLLVIPFLVFIYCSTHDRSTSDNNVDFTPTEPPAGFPNNSNTGLSNPSLLSTDLSSLNAVSLGYEAIDDQIVENLEIRGRLILNGDNITVRNCRIWGDMPDEDGFAKGYAVQVFPDPPKDVTVTIENCEIGQDANTWPNHIFGVIASARQDSQNITIIIRNCYFRYLHDGMFFGSLDYDANISITVEDNYFVYIYAEDGEPGHDIDDHKGDGIESNGPLYNSVISGNSIDIPSDQTSCILLQSNWGNLDDITISNNWLNGAGYSLKVRQRVDTTAIFTDVTIMDNQFGRSYEHGPFDAYDFDTDDLDNGNVTGNIRADTGLPIESMIFE